MLPITARDRAIFVSTLVLGFAVWTGVHSFGLDYAEESERAAMRKEVHEIARKISRELCAQEPYREALAKAVTDLSAACTDTVPQLLQAARAACVTKYCASSGDIASPLSTEECVMCCTESRKTSSACADYFDEMNYELRRHR